MLQSVLEELSPHYDQFQAAGIVGCKKLQQLPFEGLQFTHRRLQREAMLNAFFTQLPPTLGSFKRVDDSYRVNRLIYQSEEMNAQLIFRRKGSISFMAEKKRREQTVQMALFSVVNSATTREEFRQIAVIWDFPPLDEDNEPTGPLRIVFRLAEAGTSLDERRWESTAAFEINTELMPDSSFDPNGIGWDIDDAEDNSQVQGK